MATAHAQPGAFDPNFGMDGETILSLSSIFTVTSPVAIDLAGRIIGGVETNDDSFNESHSVFALLPDGRLDTTFGGSAGAGFARVLPDAQAQIGGLTVDGSNRIVVAGGSGRTAMVERLLADGSPDETFGNGGIAYLKLPATLSSYIGQNVAVGLDGHILVVGEAFDDNGATAVVLKLDEAGNPALFGNGGVALLLPGANTTQAFATGIAIDAAGKPIVSGAVLKQDGSIRGLLMKLTDSGTLDTSFGNGGFLEVDAIANQRQHFTELTAVTVDHSNRIVATGPVHSDSGKWAFYTTRVFDDGSADSSFTPAFGDGQANVAPASVSVDHAGRIVVSGITSGGVVVYRLKSDGSADTAFGDGGQRNLELNSFVESSGLTAEDDIVLYTGLGDGDGVVYKLQGN